MDLSSAWVTARVILGENSNLTRMAKLKVVTNSKRLANLFKNLFRTKIQRDEPPPPFQLKPIDKKMFRRIIAKMKQDSAWS